MKLEDLLKDTPHEGKTKKPPKADTRMDEIEDAIIELAALIVGKEEV